MTHLDSIIRGRMGKDTLNARLDVEDAQETKIPKETAISSKSICTVGLISNSYKNKYGSLHVCLEDSGLFRGVSSPSSHDPSLAP